MSIFIFDEFCRKNLPLVEKLRQKYTLNIADPIKFSSNRELHILETNIKIIGNDKEINDIKIF